MQIKIANFVRFHLELINLSFLTIISVIPRLFGLGYSNFYGDETKILYLNKTVPALTFFLDQRKGPIQFLVAWIVEKFVGYDPLWMRFPFAIAGILSVVAFYFLIKKLFNTKVAFLASLMFSASGFNIAFSRTAQYQTFLILFSILFLLAYLYALEKKNKWLFLTSALLFSLAFYAHYETIFFLIPAAVFTIRDIQKKRILIKDILYFAVPALVLISVFLLPYAIQGYLESNTLNYLVRRVTGSGYQVNNSLYTYFVYNPFRPAIILLLIPIIFIFKKDFKTSAMFFWFIIGIILYEFILLNPGTHIHLYFIPLYILSSVGFLEILDKRKLFALPFVFVFLIHFYTNFNIFIPQLNKAYPWSTSNIALVKYEKINKNYHLFLYGFPYNRSWQDIRAYFDTLDGVRGVYTNDNDTVAQYYMLGYDYTPAGSNFLPPYYVHVYNSQELGLTDTRITPEKMLNYALVKQIFNETGLVADIYKLTQK